MKGLESIDWTSERAEVLKQIALLQQSVQNVALAQAIAIKDMKDDIAELRAYLTKVINDLNVKGDERSKAINDMQFRLNSRLCDEHESDLKKIKDDMQWMRPAVKILIWLGGVVGISVVALIWSIITHTVTLIR